MEKKIFLFETSWEVCNKVGGIYTVLRTKAKNVMHHFGDNYILIGPWLDENRHFVEVTTPFLEKVATLLAEKGFLCRIGYWDVGYSAINEQPLVILVSYKKRYKIDLLLYNLWTDFGIDSLASNYEYYEPILFSTASAEVIKAISENLLPKDMKIIAHFHEWLCGAGVLYLKSHATDIVSVFTTHATVLGRSLSGTNRLIYDLPKDFNPTIEAKISGVFAKHSLEKAAAREADCFTTVSNITADEANIMLNKYPDKIVPNGLDMVRVQQLKHEEQFQKTRDKLLQIATSVIGRNIQKNAQIWLTGGRYEFHNKGYDLLLDALAQLESQLTPEDSEIVVFFLIAASRRTKQDSLLTTDFSNMPQQRNAAGIATHKLYNPIADSIIKKCNELNLRGPNRRVHVIYSDAYLDGVDGVFDMQYEQILTACDLSLFLSFYEPWGYTPLESIAYGAPTITTDLAGFGSWIMSLKEDYGDAVYVLERKNKSQEEILKNLTAKLIAIIRRDPDQNRAAREKALVIATLAGWDFFYKEYLDAYDQAVEFNDIYYARLDTSDPANKYYTLIHEPETIQPRFRIMQNEAQLPEELKGLRDIAYNFWWSWHDSVKYLFQAIDPILWDKVKHNPVHFLNNVSQSALMKKTKDENYLREYRDKLQYFYSYCEDRLCPMPIKELIGMGQPINAERPIAYFCMEYGLDECLPIYSGGLGILAGDYLKTMSDLNIPLIAIGLFYKQGYFRQSINFQNEQIALFETEDPNQIPMHSVNDESGKKVLISVEILERTVYVRIWEIKIGRIKLYLLDTDVIENSAQDRDITSRLYSGLRETRIVQEIILGIAGERFLTEKLKVRPSIYHLNEGHSAFLLLERLKNYIRSGLSFCEACEAICSSTIFTTHTSIPAGNEVFSDEMIKKYFAKYQEQISVPLEKIIAIARDFEQKIPIFSLTALALKSSVGANAVSKIHGEISRSLWKNIWPGLLESELPIDEITNGIHLSTWVGNSMKILYDNYLGQDWKIRQNDSTVWDKVSIIPDKAIWDTHQRQKERLLDAVRERIVREYPLRNEGKTLISASLNSLDDDILLIGFARRFTPYKRNTLILRDKDRLARILTNEHRPIVLLVAGKAHPLDAAGKDLVRNYIEAIRDTAFKGHIIFLEEYDMTLAKILTQGIDVWLNTPLLGREACGTSGMKVGLNGGLNFSVNDGWWHETHDPRIGWSIDSYANLTDADQRNDMENMYLLDTLEYSIAPLYYEKRQLNYNPAWIEKMKASISKIAYQYSSQRMAFDYFNKFYNPIANYFAELEKDNFAKLKELVSWKHEMRDRFNTVKIKTILINGIKEGKIMSGGPIRIKVLLFSGKLKAKELKVELLLAKNEEGKISTSPSIIPLHLEDSRESGILTYITDYNIEDTGFYSYGIRVMPQTPNLLRWQDIGIVYWG